MDELDEVDVKVLVIHRRVCRLNYSRRSAEASAVQAHMKTQEFHRLRNGDSYVVKDTCKQEVDRREQNTSSMLYTIESCWKSPG